MRIGEINIGQGEIVTTEGELFCLTNLEMIVSDLLVSRMNFSTVFHAENLNA